MTALAQAWIFLKAAKKPAGWLKNQLDWDKMGITSHEFIDEYKLRDNEFPSNRSQEEWKKGIEGEEDAGTWRNRRIKLMLEGAKLLGVKPESIAYAANRVDQTSHERGWDMAPRMFPDGDHFFDQVMDEEKKEGNELFWEHLENAETQDMSSSPHHPDSYPTQAEVDRGEYYHPHYDEEDADSFGPH